MQAMKFPSSFASDPLLTLVWVSQKFQFIKKLCVMVTRMVAVSSLTSNKMCFCSGFNLHYLCSLEWIIYLENAAKIRQLPFLVI